MGPSNEAVDGNNPGAIEGTIDGAIEAIDEFSLAGDDMAFFLVDSDLEVTRVGEPFAPGTGSGTYELDDPAGVAAGDMIGLYFGNDGGSIAFIGSGSDVYSQGNSSGFQEVEDVLVDTRAVDRTYSVVAQIVPAPPATKDACKNGGWEDCTHLEFRNQGQCVAFLMANENAGKR